MMTANRCFMLLAMLALVSCTTQTAPVDREALLTSLTTANAEYEASLAALDIESATSWYSADAVLYMPGLDALAGVDAIREFMDAAAADPNVAAEFSSGYAAISDDGALGYTMSPMAHTYTGEDGTIVTDHMRDFHVWRRSSDGAWQLVIDVANTAPAQEE